MMPGEIGTSPFAAFRLRPGKAYRRLRADWLDRRLVGAVPRLVALALQDVQRSMDRPSRSDLQGDVTLHPMAASSPRTCLAHSNSAMSSRRNRTRCLAVLPFRAHRRWRDGAGRIQRPSSLQRQFALVGDAMNLHCTLAAFYREPARPRGTGVVLWWIVVVAFGAEEGPGILSPLP